MADNSSGRRLFEIDAVKFFARRVTVVFARFFSHLDISLVALDDLDHPFYYEEASDFWEKMGKNTDYVNAPEECLAVNFSYAIIFGMDYEYKTPELIRSILSALK